MEKHGPKDARNVLRRNALIDPEFLQILRCPLHPEGPPLTQKGAFLICNVDGAGFRVVDGIPRMLPDDAIPAIDVQRELDAKTTTTTS